VPSLQAKTPELKAIAIPLNEKSQSAGCGIAINKNNPALTADIDRIISDLKKDGTLKKLEDRWFKEKS
jgi:ABC-type amino acid transport substrate-binding protein